MKPGNHPRRCGNGANSGGNTREMRGGKDRHGHRIAVLSALTARRLRAFSLAKSENNADEDEYARREANRES